MRSAFLKVARFRRTLAHAFVPVCLAYASPALGQSLTCEQARDILLASSSTRDDRYHAIAKAVNACGNGGPIMIARALRAAAPLSTADTVARTGAYALLDRRLADSVRVLARDQSQTTERRRYFLRLLTRYVAANASIDERFVDADAPSVLVPVSDGGGVVGWWARVR
jgi:hypothetical protein